MSFGQRQGPVWQVDGFSTCQNDYLRVLIPLAAVALSVLRIAANAIGPAVRARRAYPYQPDHPIAEPTATDDAVVEEDNGGDPAPTTAPPSVHQANGASRMRLLITIELLAVGGLIIVNIYNTTGPCSQVAAVLGSIAWAYIQALVAMRIASAGWRVSGLLWIHSAFLYSVQWLLSIVFAWIQPPPSRPLAFAEISLTSLLFVITITRQGNESTIPQSEPGIVPSPEPRASLLSAATFSWVFPMIWMGYKEPITMNKVWELPPEDKPAAVLDAYNATKADVSLVWGLLKPYWRELRYQWLTGAFAGALTCVPSILLRAILRHVETPAAPDPWMYVILLPVVIITRSVVEGLALWTGRKLSYRVYTILVSNVYNETLGSNTARQLEVGGVMNHVSTDCRAIAETIAYLHVLTAMAPVELGMSIILLWWVMGYSAVPGIATTVLMPFLGYRLAKPRLADAAKNTREATSERLERTDEVVRKIIPIKLNTCTSQFIDKLKKRRDREQKALRSWHILRSCGGAFAYLVVLLSTFSSFFVYTVVEGKPLYPSVAFPALSVFMLLQGPLDHLSNRLAQMQDARVALDRVEEFLPEDKLGKDEHLGTGTNERGNKVIGFENATVTWGDQSGGQDSTMPFRLTDFDVEFAIGELNLITGPTGSGKSSVLLALLGKMRRVEGKIYAPGRPIAYADESPWLSNTSIKENILFGAEYDKERYEEVITACALKHDLEKLDDEGHASDEVNSLSGGQKQRISLARALYSHAQLVLLDNSLSAVDSPTARWILENCIQGPLMKGRTCILVSHNVRMYAQAAYFIVVVKNGHIIKQGLAADVVASGELDEDVQEANPASTHGGSSDDAHSAAVHAAEDDDSEPKSNGKIEAPEEKEDEATWQALRLYLRAMGPRRFWIVTLAAFGFRQLSDVVINIWAREWAGQYQLERVSDGSGSFGLKLQDLSVSYGWTQQDNPGTIITMVAPKVNAAFYLVILASIGAVGCTSVFLSCFCVFCGSLRASREIHNNLITSVCGAWIELFHGISGSIMNLASNEQKAVDLDIPPIIKSIIDYTLYIVVTVITISYITPPFLIAGTFIAVVFCMAAWPYLKTSRELKRLESQRQSDLLQHFSETLHGLATIRAYRNEERYREKNKAHIEKWVRVSTARYACNRLFTFLCFTLGNLMVLVAGIFAVLGQIQAGGIGVCIGLAANIGDGVQQLVREVADIMVAMVSVSRIAKYSDLKSEATDAERDPPENWPARGGVEFVGYTARYRRGGPVLHDISFKVEPRQKIGIVGRTGAGKSSIARAICWPLEAETGKVMVDGVDIGPIRPKRLRQGIAIVLQETAVFTGTLRFNLDPSNDFKDDHILTTLRSMHVIGPNEAIDLSSPAAELSRGRKQLVCLARAILREPRVLIMDEATASLDHATEAKIQEKIRELKCTVITIAHRLVLVKDYDRVLVLDEGRVREDGHPHDLIKKGGKFRAMCEASGISLPL